MSMVTDPRLDATKTYQHLSTHLVCDRPCPCRNTSESQFGPDPLPGLQEFGPHARDRGYRERAQSPLLGRLPGRARLGGRR